MGHSFGLLIRGAFPGARRGARSNGMFTSSRHYSVLVLGLCVAVILPISRAGAQESTPAPAGENDVQLLKPKGPDQATPPTTVTLQDALERARKLDPTLLGAVSDAQQRS